MVCLTYRKIKGSCSPHQIQNEVTEEFLLDSIQSLNAYVWEHEGDFVALIAKKSQAELEISLRVGKPGLEQVQIRNRKPDKIIQGLYEDNIEGKVSDERFAKMTASYEEEHHELESRVTELKKLIAS